ncbi:MAG: DUF3574 domain-containing protein [Anaerovoracaceae bacterium]
MNSFKKISKFKIVVIVIMILESIALSGIIIYLASNHHAQSDISGNGTVLNYDYSENGKYVLYIGLNDKDTYSQIISAEAAKDIVNGICAKYVDGYTVMEANGGWVDETGTLTEEMSLVYTLCNVEEEDVVSIMNEVLTALNQNSILVERQDISFTYYSGK